MESITILSPRSEVRKRVEAEDERKNNKKARIKKNRKDNKLIDKEVMAFLKGEKDDVDFEQH